MKQIFVILNKMGTSMQDYTAG